MDTKAAAIAVWDAFKSRDRDRIASVLTDDVEWIAPPGNATAAALGVTNHMIGPNAIADFIIDDMPRLFSNGIQFEPISVTAEGNLVVFEQVQSAVLSNGRSYRNIYVFIFEMAGSKARRIREYMDTLNGSRMVFGEAEPGCIAA